MKLKNLARFICAIATVCFASSLAVHAQNYHIVTKFSLATEGPGSPLVQGTNGNLYTTDSSGGKNHSTQYCGEGTQDYCGSFLELTPTGKLSVLYNFCSLANCIDGGNPPLPPVLGPNGNFYGSTSTGGTSPKLSCQWSNGCGTIYEITSAGKFTVLHNTCVQTNCADGLGPSRLLLGANGNFYGTMESGGILNGDAGCPNGCGTVFEMSPTGKFTTLYEFCSQIKGATCLDGVFPSSGLVLAENGNFYGTTYYGGSSGVGNIFEMTPSGKLTQIYSFCSQANCADGRLPTGPLTLGSDGNIYGTTSEGGVGGGTAYMITPDGSFTTLYTFCYWATTSCPDGSTPAWGLIQATDSNFYSTTSNGGIVNNGLCASSGCGTAFQLTLGGELTNLYSFCAQANCTDGAFPDALMQATNGNFYGIADKGGIPGCLVGGGCGVAYILSSGLKPFVQANPGFGHVGQILGILGNNLMGATSVTFNGTPAKFKVVSDTFIGAEVPTGASSGEIEVTTPNGTLSSNFAFKVLP